MDGSYTFDNYAPENLNNTGLEFGSAEFSVWLMVDSAFCFGKGKIGFATSGANPATLQRQLAGEKGIKASPCNYELTEWEKNDGGIVARFRHVEWSEVEQHRAAQRAEMKLHKLKAQVESERAGGSPSMALIDALVAMIEAQQRQLDLFDQKLDSGEWRKFLESNRPKPKP